MAAVDIKGIFPPTTTKYRSTIFSGNAVLIKDSFTLSTLLLIGALIQGIISFIFPARYAIIPIVLLLARALISTIKNINSLPEYLASQGVVNRWVSAQLPKDSYSPSKSTPFGSRPAAQDLVVFHLGARFQHPLGPLAPGAKELGEHFDRLNKELLKEAKKYGCIDISFWNGQDRASVTTILAIYYFKDVKGLNQFAHDPMHRKAWDWFANFQKAGGNHLGIFHETFEVKKGGHETIYVDMQPLLLGAGSVPVKNEETGQEEWVRTLVDAGKGAKNMKGQFRRMGRGKDGLPVEDDE